MRKLSAQADVRAGHSPPKGQRGTSYGQTISEQSHRADLDVPHRILKGHEEYVSHQDQPRGTQYVSSYFKCAHGDLHKAYSATSFDAAGPKAVGFEN
jgi:hypothetical protein